MNVPHEKDVDLSERSPHHTLGNSHNQASRGDHGHLESVVITGSRASGAALVSVIAALVELGATDATSA